MGNPTKAEIAVAHVLRAMRDDGRKAYLFGNGSQTYALLTEAYAETNGLDLEQFRAEFWSHCRPERIIAAPEESDDEQVHNLHLPAFRDVPRRGGRAGLHGGQAVA
jgi:hypothetical protein